MKTSKRIRSNKNYLGNLNKAIKKSNFAIFIVFTCLALIFCVVTLKNIVDIAYGIDDGKTASQDESSEYVELFNKIDNLKTSDSNKQERLSNTDNPFSE